MRTYLVGGAVRDRLLGCRAATAIMSSSAQTQEAMLARGFKPVGRDFPVFLHPQTGEEYALARTERKSGRGYRGFVVDADPAVTLEEDLAAATSPSMRSPQDDDGTWSIRSAARATSKRACCATSVRRSSRIRCGCCARRASWRASPRSGFQIAPETMALMRAMVASGELSTRWCPSACGRN